MNIFKLFKKSKKYGHIISLGYNCEVAYQFFLYHKFVESSLFTWAYTKNINNIIYALNNLDKLITGQLENIRPLWKCFNTNILFHGKAPTNIWLNNDNVNENIINEDKKELISRITHLKNKFIATGNDNKKNLYIFKYLIENNNINEIKTNINNLYYLLNDIIKNPFDLLIIFEKDKIPQNFENQFKDKHIYIRTVDFYAIDTDVIRSKSDKKGWKKIFKEFKPNYKLKQKVYKFEDL